MVPSTVLSMAFFEKLSNEKVVRSDTGNIVKCFDEYLEDFTISDELRKVSVLSNAVISCFNICG